MSKLISLLLTLFVVSLVQANPLQPDSFKPPKTTSQSSTQTTSTPRLPRLQSIVIVGDVKKAIFNGSREVEEGSSISGYQVVEVTANAVTLARGNTRRTLYLKTTGTFNLSPAEEE